MIDLSLTDDQRAMTESVLALLGECGAVRRPRISGALSDVHRRLAEWGWFGVGLPAQSDGMDLSPADEAMLYVHAGRFVLPPSVLAAALGARLADSELRGRILDGRARASLSMWTSADEAYCFDRQDDCCILLVDGDEYSLYPPEAFKGSAIDCLDDAVELEKGTLDRGMCLGRECGNRAILLVAAMLTGIAQASCDIAVEYAKTRQQFGQPIGAFQAIKHRCADMALGAFAAMAQLRMAAACTVAGALDAGFQTAAAAHIAISAALSNSSGAIQIHGGMGFTADCDAHIYLKRAHLLSRLIGGIEASAARVVGWPGTERS